MDTKRTYLFFSLLLAISFIVSCSKKEEEQEPTPIVTSECSIEYQKNGRMKLTPVDEYFLCLNEWKNISPAKPDDPGTKQGDPSKPIKEGDYICTTQDYSLTKTPDSIVLLGDSAGDLWLGSLLQSQPYLDGKFQQLPAKLAAMDVTINLSIAEPSVLVDNPSNASIQKAISTLVNRAQGTPLPAKASYNFKEAYSTEQLLLDFNLSAKYAGQSAKAALSIDKKTETKTISAYFVQNMFTVSVPPPVTPSAYFNDITLEYLKDQQQLGKISAENPPLYVSSVTYGRLLLFTFSSSASSSEIQASLDYAYKGAAEVDAKSKAKYDKILSEAEINIVPYGGAWQDAARLIRSASIKDYFSDDAAPLTTAVPISYQLKTLARDVQAAVAETTSYSEKSCKKAEAPAITKNAKFTLQYVGGGDNRYLSKAEWFQVGLEGKRPYPTLQLSPVKLLLRGNKQALTSGTNIRFSTTETKAGGRNLDKKTILGAWSSKKYVSYLASDKSSKQNWIFTKVCPQKCADNYIRYGDKVNIRSEYKPKQYLCNDSDKKSHWLITKEAKCTWRINR